MTIAEQISHEYLFGDLVFSGTATEGGKPVDQLRARSDISGRPDIPDWLWEKCDFLRLAASTFIGELSLNLISERFDVFGFNCMFQCLPSIALAKAIKTLDSTKIIILGGANCEGSMGSALHRAFPWIDYVCRGEGEKLVLELNNHLSSGRPALDEIDGLIWRKEGESRVNSPRALPIDDLDELPSPSYDNWIQQLKDSGIYSEIGRLSLPIETSRGCWYGQKNHCIFCGLSGESLAYRTKSPQRALAHLQGLLRYDIENVFAVDLIFPNDYFKSFLPDLRAREWPLSIFYEIKANLRREQLIALRDAGVNQLQPGIESLNSNILRILRKGVFSYQNVRLLKWAAELGIGTEWNLLFGVPGAEPADYDEMSDLIPLIAHLRPPTVGCNRVRIDRFSPLEYRAADFGITELTPASAYRYVYGLNDELLQDLAYFFEPALPTSPAAEQAIQRLKTQVGKWYLTKGDATLVALSDNERFLHIFDRRPCAVADVAKLSGIDKLVFELCDDGRTLQQLTALSGAEPMLVKKTLQRLLEMKWIVFIDDRYLSLPTNLDDIVAMERFPESTLGEVVASVQRARMQPIWRTVSSYDAIFLESVQS